MRFVVACFGLACLLCVSACSVLTHNDKFEVIALPAIKAPNPYLLDATKPLFAQPRPQETFLFPIHVGQIGPVQPLFAGNLQYPFACETRESDLGQPLVDNHERVGTAVYKEANGEITDEVIGYSKDCLIPMRVDYVYLSKKDHKIYPYQASQSDNDLLYVENKGDSASSIPLIFRVERGSINRFLYMITVLKGPADTPEKADMTYWNKRLIYQMKGGVGIGRRQGKLNVASTIEDRLVQLKQGYALAYTTGNHSRQHYNLLLSEDTALRLKQQFISAYGKPLYTVGVGGSGGGLHQYLFMQNNDAILDAAIPQYSYPDMSTQTMHALDCDLLGYYFDIQRHHEARWQDWEQRQLIEGMNARNGAKQKYQFFHMASQLAQGYWPSTPTGASECTNGWRGLASLTTNPNFFYSYTKYSETVFNQTHWTYWDDLENIYGLDDQGFARRTWDNVGVQYGLQALQQKLLSPEVFLDLNQHIGGWKAPEYFQQELFWLLLDGKLPIWFSVWGQNNINLAKTKQDVAPRTTGDLQAINMAYMAGQVFIGRAPIPIIDVRHHLEDRLDMHHMQASFATRLRIEEFQGNADNQLIWVSHPDFNPTDLAFKVMDEWMLGYLKSGDLIQSKPRALEDSCFDQQGQMIAQGPSVWDGEWNGKKEGVCTQIYPSYTNSRIVAGSPMTSRVFKCHLQSVETALEKGVYGAVDMRPFLADLKRIFPQGVCDFEREDMGMPEVIQQYLIH